MNIKKIIIQLILSWSFIILATMFSIWGHDLGVMNTAERIFVVMFISIATAIIIINEYESTKL